MKKGFICLLLAVCMVLSACDGKKEEPTGGDVPQQGDITVADDAYKTLECHDVSRFRQVTYAFEESAHFINLYFSHEWLIKTESKGEIYSIIRGKDVIGQLTTAPYVPSDNWKVVAEQSTEYKGLTIAEYVEKDTAATTPTFRCRYLYAYAEGDETKSINITVNYTEAGEEIRYELYEHVDFEAFSDHSDFGTLSRIRDGRILILGNSFIGTSEVGAILQEMADANQKWLDVEAISRGYAKVETYTGDADLMYKIEHGNYNAVFICGFYNSEQIAELGILKTACDKPNAELILFPAHNESRSVIDNAASIYSGLTLIDWKNEIDLLIEQGVSKSDMCINDAHQHSTELAGYVGAHMIYRAIFGTVPTATLNQYRALQLQAEQILGDYLNSGVLYEVDYYLK